MPHAPRTVTPELLRSALAHVSAAVPRDEWARVGMAIKSEFPGAEGLALFDEWSRTAGDAYSAQAVKSTWRSIKPGGGVTVATLLALAKDGGFELPAPGTAGGPALPPPSKAEAARQAREREAQAKAEGEQTHAAQAEAARQAAEMWDRASDTGEHLYLQRKGVQAHGVRFSQSGFLLVPLRDADGSLWNLQRIMGERPATGTDKLYLKHGRKSGLWHWLAAPEAAPGAQPGAPHSPSAAVIVVCEGYATAASVYEATGHPTACAFDAPNLVHVARTLHKLHPGALIVVAGDDDADTAARTGTNPGRVKASEAARVARGLAVFPADLPEGGTDFNDMAQAHGLDTVRVCIEQAIAAHRAGLQGRQGVAHGPGRSDAPSEPRRAPHAPHMPNGTSHRDDDSPGHGGAGTAPRDRFYVDDEGVWATTLDREGNPGRPILLCAPLRAVALARDIHGNRAALLLEFESRFGLRRWLMPLAMLAGDGASYRNALYSQAFMPPTQPGKRALLSEYLQTREPADRVYHVSRVGWHGHHYVLPGETLSNSPEGERPIFFSESATEARFAQRGTAQAWREQLARLCIGNSRMMFAVSVAFAGPTLAWSPSTTAGGFHWGGATSAGKSTSLQVAASVWGKGTENDPDSYMQKWRATSAGLEFQGEQHNDGCLILDELGQLDPREAGKSSYMLADGMGRTRGKADGGLRPKATWRLLYLSSGEVTLEDMMRQAGERMLGGQEVRLITIPAEVSSGSVTETNHEFATGHEMSGHIKRQVALTFGTVGREWLENLVAHGDVLRPRLVALVDEIERHLLDDVGHASGQVKRGARRFAHVAAAGELATERGHTGWLSGQATWCALQCFNAWVTTRAGGFGSSETANILRHTLRWFELNGDGRFPWWHDANHATHAPRVMNRAGVRCALRDGGKAEIREPWKGLNGAGAMENPIEESNGQANYYVSAEVFRAELCNGFNERAVCHVLVEHGVMPPPRQESNGAGRPASPRYTTKQRLPGYGNSTTCYLIKGPVLFGLDL